MAAGILLPQNCIASTKYGDSRLDFGILKNQIRKGHRCREHEQNKGQNDQKLPGTFEKSKKGDNAKARSVLQVLITSGLLDTTKLHCSHC